jgi:ABC-type lipoprotein release transport system permease subunit
MTIWQIGVLGGLLGAVIGMLWTIIQQLERLIRHIVALRAELRVANGQETTGDFISKLGALGLYDGKSKNP